MTTDDSDDLYVLIRLAALRWRPVLVHTRCSVNSIATLSHCESNVGELSVYSSIHGKLPFHHDAYMSGFMVHHHLLVQTFICLYRQWHPQFQFQIHVGFDIATPRLRDSKFSAARQTALVYRLLMLVCPT
jgi:hypothetical protein